MLRRKITIPTILKIPDRLWDEIKSILPKDKPLKTVGSRDNHTLQKSNKSDLLCIKNKRMSMEDAT